MESKYVILSDNTKSGLERKVISYLESGYQLAGGVQITVLENDVRSNSTGLYHFEPEKLGIFPSSE